MLLILESSGFDVWEGAKLVRLVGVEFVHLKIKGDLMVVEGSGWHCQRNQLVTSGSHF